MTTGFLTSPVPKNSSDEMALPNFGKPVSANAEVILDFFKKLRRDAMIIF